MYRIIGADGKEYGPIAAEVLKKWVVDGRANAQTRVLLEGTTEWRTLADFPELTATLSSPPPFAGHASVMTPTAAANDVSGPAIGLIVTAALGFLATIFGIVWNLVLTGVGMHQPGLNPQEEQILNILRGTMGLVSAVLGFIAAGLILFGALKMRKLESYGWAMTASILAIIPCVSPCCLIGLPIGIWALVVLSKPEVKSQFH